MGTASAALVQDVVVYTDGISFFAQGDIDQKIIMLSEDAAEVIQASIDSIAEEGGEVLIKSGRYPIRKTLNMKSHTHMRGRGRSTKLLVNIADAEACAISLVGLKGSGVSELALVSMDGNEAVSGVALKHCGDCKVINVYAQDFPKYGLYLGDNSFLCEMRGCSLAGNQKAGIMMDQLKGGGRGGDYVPNLISNCISSKGKESVVGENLSHLPLSHHGKIQPANPAEHIYQFFDTRYLETFIEE